MHARQFRARAWWLALCVSMAMAPAVAGQSSRPATASARVAQWTPPRLADGRPDLEGTWENNSATPLERPQQLAGKPLLSVEEVAAMEARAASVFGPEADAVFGDSVYLSLLEDKPPALVFPTGTYSQNWVPTRYFERRTSLIEDPADGRLPPLTPQALERRAANAAALPPRARGAADFSLADRCITFGVPDLFAA